MNILFPKSTELSSTNLVAPLSDSGMKLTRCSLPRLGLVVATRSILVVLPIERPIGTDRHSERGGHDHVHLMHEFLLLGT